jgi:iron complex outermembrane receptor protein
MSSLSAPRKPLLLSLAPVLALGCGPIFAQSAAPGSTLLETIIVEGRIDASTGQRFNALPGGVALVSREDMPESANLTVSRALQLVPGVVVQDFFGGNDQPRIQIRGSGLQQNPVERGILMLQDGLPLNRADGSYIVGFANPGDAALIEVYRGYMANRLGAHVLGGAVNLVSPTGSERQGPALLVNGGSFGQRGLSGSFGFQTGAADAFLQASHANRDGFRDYNASERATVGANLGYRFSETVKSRFFFGYTDLDFDVSGPLTWHELQSNPRQVHAGPRVLPGGIVVDPGPNVIRDQPGRKARQVRLGIRTTASLGAHLLDAVIGYSHTDDTFRFPIASDQRTTTGGDVTAVLRHAYAPDASRALPLIETTAQLARGSAKRSSHLNAAGVEGALFGKSDFDATTWSVHTGMNLPLGTLWTLSPGLSYTGAVRDNTDRYSQATRPTIAFNPANPGMRLPDGAVPTVSNSYARSYSDWTPSLALSFKPHRFQTLYVAASRSFEPPTHDDLLATINGTPNSSPGRPQPPNPAFPAAVYRTPDLAAQTATTIELGWRGHDGQRWNWDAVIFHSEVRHELLSLRDVTGSSLGAVNADRTQHSGLELAIGTQITPTLASRIAWTYQDFHFRNDPLRGNNKLAGAPRNVLSTRARYTPAPAWSFEATGRWLPGRTPVDNMNTLYKDAYAIVDLRAGYTLNARLHVYAEINNLFDTTYAASTLIVDQARADQAAFLPGDGRGVFAGVRLRLR